MKRFLLACLLSLTSMFALGADKGVVSLPSHYSVPETISRLESVLKEKGLKIFTKIDHAAQAEKAGLKMRPTQLLIFGNPKTGTPVMKAEPAAAIDFPLKALAWEDAQGKVWLSYNDPAYLQERFKLPDDVMKPIMGIGNVMKAALK